MIYSSRNPERDSTLRVALYSHCSRSHITLNQYHALTKWLDCYQYIPAFSDKFLGRSSREFYPRTISLTTARDLYSLAEQPAWLTYKEQESLCRLLTT